MRKAFLLPVILLFSIVGCKSQGPVKNELTAMNDQLMDKVFKCADGEMELFGVFQSGDSVRIKSEIKRFNDTCKQFQYEIEKMKVNKEFEDLRSAFWAVIVEYYNLEDKYKELGRLSLIPENSRTEEEKKLFYRLADQISGRVYDERDILRLTQVEYNKKYNVVLKGSERK